MEVSKKAKTDFNMPQNEWGKPDADEGEEDMEVSSEVGGEDKTEVLLWWKRPVDLVEEEVWYQGPYVHLLEVTMVQEGDCALSLDEC